jgi:predicted MFS family arabinose efflux permease
VVTQYASWKWIFHLVAIISLAITVIAYFIIPPPATNRPKKNITLDYFGAFLITTSLILLIFTLSQGNSGAGGWHAPYIPSLILVCVILFMIFVGWEWWLEHKTQNEPLMRLSLWNHRGFTMSMIVTGFFWASFNNYMVYATFLYVFLPLIRVLVLIKCSYQDFLHLSPIATTLRFLPTGIGGALITVVSGYLLSRVPGQHLLLVGATCTAFSSVLMAAPIPPETSYWAFGFEAMVLAVMGADTIYPCLSLYTTSSMPMKDQALAGGIFNTVAQVGRAIGLALVTAVDVSVREGGGNVLGDLPPNKNKKDNLEEWVELAGIRTSQWVNVGFALIALVAVIYGLRNIGKVGAAKPDADET